MAAGSKAAGAPADHASASGFTELQGANSSAAMRSLARCLAATRARAAPAATAATADSSGAGGAHGSGRGAGKGADEAVGGDDNSGGFAFCIGWPPPTAFADLAQAARVHVQCISSGYEESRTAFGFGGGFAAVVVNGKAYTNFGRGVNAVAIDPGSAVAPASVINADHGGSHAGCCARPKRFDTWAVAGDDGLLRAWLTDVKDHHASAIVALACLDECQKHLTDATYALLGQFGVAELQTRKGNLRDSWAFIGRSGVEASAAVEELKNRGTGFTRALSSRGDKANTWATVHFDVGLEARTSRIAAGEGGIAAAAVPAVQLASFLLTSKSVGGCRDHSIDGCCFVAFVDVLATVAAVVKTDSAEAATTTTTAHSDTLSAVASSWDVALRVLTYSTSQNPVAVDAKPLGKWVTDHFDSPPMLLKCEWSSRAGRGSRGAGIGERGSAGSEGSRRASSLSAQVPLDLDLRLCLKQCHEYTVLPVCGSVKRQGEVSGELGLAAAKRAFGAAGAAGAGDRDSLFYVGEHRSTARCDVAT